MRSVSTKTEQTAQSRTSILRVDPSKSKDLPQAPQSLVAASITLLRTLPVLHVDETSDLETKNIWMVYHEAVSN
jgi:hypothetical protein